MQRYKAPDDETTQNASFPEDDPSSAESREQELYAQLRQAKLERVYVVIIALFLSLAVGAGVCAALDEISYPSPLRLPLYGAVRHACN